MKLITPTKDKHKDQRDREDRESKTSHHPLLQPSANYRTKTTKMQRQHAEPQRRSNRRSVQNQHQEDQEDQEQYNALNRVSEFGEEDEDEDEATQDEEPGDDNETEESEEVSEEESEEAQDVDAGEQNSATSATSAALPSHIKAAVNVFLQKSEAAKEASKHVAAIRKEAKAAQKVLEKYMQDTNMTELKLGTSGRTIQRKEKKTVQVNKKAVQESRVLSASNKTALLKEATKTKTAFVVSN